MRGLSMDVRRYLEYMTLSPLVVIQSFFIGLVVGFLVMASNLGLQAYALEPLFCQGTNQQYCDNVPLISIVLMTIVFHFIGLVALVRIGIIRPLLVVLATIVTLYGVHMWTQGLPWWGAILYAALLSGLAYLYFSWINRATQFPLALGLTVISVIIARLVLS